MSISLWRRGGASIVTSQTRNMPLQGQVAVATVASISNGWCGQPWPGTTQWPNSTLLPAVFLGQATIEPSIGKGWLLSAWPGRGTWPYCLPQRSLRGQYRGQSGSAVVGASIAQYLSAGKTNLGSDSTEFCARPWCASGVWVSEGWMFLSHFTQARCAIYGSKRLSFQVLIPTKKRQIFSVQYLVINPVDNVDPQTQIHIYTGLISFGTANFGAQISIERARHLVCQWKKRPF